MGQNKKTDNRKTDHIMEHNENKAGQKSNENNIKNLIIAALFAAMITVVTAYVAHIPIGTGGGYLHFGDALIYLAACILPAPYAIAAAVIGAGLADLLTAPMWVIATVIIKALSALLFSSKKAKIVCTRNLWCLPVALCLTVGGYYVAEAVLYGNWVSPSLSIIGNLIQAGGSIFFYIILGLALDKAEIKRRIYMK